MKIVFFFFLKPISENLVCEVNNSNKFIQKISYKDKNIKPIIKSKGKIQF
ncbi:hypothetical protein HpVH116_11290 [Helicobacter pylori]